MKKNTVEIFVDGACRGNPGPGGWGVLLRYGEHEKQLKGAEALTTNNRMELTAAIKGISAIQRSCKVKVTTDSQYVRKGITEWIAGWKKKGWRNSKKEPVKNQDLWQALDAAVNEHDVEWFWVKGHSGHPENELVDQLANDAIDALLQEQ
ncbi:MAG: ribonuclease HI [Gammaproteobacteria bacterium]